MKKKKENVGNHTLEIEIALFFSHYMMYKSTQGRRKFFKVGGQDLKSFLLAVKNEWPKVPF